MPDDIFELIETIAARHADDIPTAVAEASVAIRKHHEYKTFADDLIDRAVRDLVYQARCRANTHLRTTDYYTDKNRPKVKPGESEAVQSVSESYFNYCIAGRTLGSLLGSQLQDVAERERSVSKGHLQNAILCERLVAHYNRKKIPLDRPVRDAVTERILARLVQDAAHVSGTIDQPTLPDKPRRTSRKPATV